jgi:hypothetical protein
MRAADFVCKVAMAEASSIPSMSDAKIVKSPSGGGWPDGARGAAYLM